MKEIDEDVRNRSGISLFVGRTTSGICSKTISTTGTDLISSYFVLKQGESSRKIGRWYNTFSFIQDALIQEYDTSFLIDLALMTKDKEWFYQLLNYQKEEVS